MQLYWLPLRLPTAGVQQLPCSAVPSETGQALAAAHAVLWLLWLLAGKVEGSGLVWLCAA